MQHKAPFTFYSHAPGGDGFTVRSFQGVDALATLFHFDIALVARDPDLDPGALLRHPARLTIAETPARTYSYHGILSRCTVERPVPGGYLYQVRLVPLAWRLTLLRSDQVFVDVSVPAALEILLREGDLGPADYEFRLRQDHAPREYVCQYEESHWRFIRRWMEHTGMYCFFDHEEGRDRLVFTDTLLAHEPPPGGADLFFTPEGGLDGISPDRSVRGFITRHQAVPAEVRVRDYNYRTPGLDLDGRAQVGDGNGFGRDYHFGDHFATPEDGARLAAVRAEEMACRGTVFQGEGTAVGLRPGFLFTLAGHFVERMNGSYLCTRIEHFGSVSGEAGDQGWDYHNRFSAIAADVQYRPRRRTPWPRITGSLSAHIDARGSGQHAELDEQGRYKVVLPFDLAGRPGGKASAWLRMAQPYAGAGHGMHFPLRKGAEVLLTFIGGNPDRPVIAAAVPNPAAPSVVTAGTENRAGFHTAGGTSLYADDSPGHQHLLIKTGDRLSGLRIGAGSDSSVAAWSANLFVGGSAMSMIGSLMAHYTFAGIMDTSITGWKFGLIMQVLEKFMLRAPAITEKFDRAFTEAAPDVIQREVDLVTSISSIIEILTELYFISLTMREMKRGDDDRAGQSAFLVYSKEGETLVRNKAAGKHIYLYTETGDIWEEGINIELISGPEKDNHVLLVSGPSNEEQDTRAEVELNQGDVFITSGHLGAPGTEEEEGEGGDAPAAAAAAESAPGDGPAPSGDVPPVADGKNVVRIVSGIQDDTMDAQAVIELMQGDMVLKSGAKVPPPPVGEETDQDAEEEPPPDIPPNSVWIISGYKGDAGNTQATAEFKQGTIEMLSGEGEDNAIRLISGPAEPPPPPEDGSEPPFVAQAIVELKQGTITLKSGDGSIVISDGTVTVTGLTVVEGAAGEDVAITSDGKIFLG